MRFFKYIIKSLHLLNIVLIIAVIFLARFAVLPVLNTGIRFTLPKINSTYAAEDEKPVIGHSPSLSEFNMVAEQNLFHPDRIMPVDKIVPPPVPVPEIVLYGTLITDNESYAYLEDKKFSYKTQGRGKRQLVLKKGSIIGDYTLTNIEDNKIELIKGENRMTVYLIDSGKPKTREAPASDAGRPITSSPGGKHPFPVPPFGSGTQPTAEIIKTENTATRKTAP